MFLARFVLDQTAYVQGLVRIRFMAPARAGEWDLWRERLAAVLGGLITLHQAHLSVRVSIPRSQVPEALYSCLTPATNELAIRSVIAAFTRLEHVAPGSAEVPASRSTFDDWATAFEPLQASVPPVSLRAGGAWFASDFRLRPLLPELLREAAALGYPLSYQLQVQPYSPRREDVKAARLNAERTADVAGAPVELVSMQRRLAVGLSSAIGVCEEFVGVADRAGAGWLQASLSRAHRSAAANGGFEPPQLTFEPGSYSDALAAGAYRAASEFGLDELCSAAVQSADLLRLMSWCPTSPADFPLPAVAAEPDGAPVTPAAEPSHRLAGPPRDTPYVFVSYLHADAAAVSPVIKLLEEWGYAVWYDRYIPGSVEWDTYLEDRVNSASLLLLCLSPGAVESRYVRREVKYGDAIGKPLLTVRLADTTLSHGLAMLLTQYQMLDARHPDFVHALKAAVGPHVHARH
jgi:hypothetical protein